MDRTKYVLYYDRVSLADLENVRCCMKPEELEDLRIKMSQILKLMKFGNFESQAIAEKAFSLGYLSSHISYPQEDRK